MPTGAIRFEADVSPLTSAAGQSRQAISSVATAAEQARQKIVASYEEQIAKAKEAGESQRQLASITRQYTSVLANTTEESAQRSINAIDRIEARLNRYRAATSKLNVPITEPKSQYTFGESAPHGVSDQQRASALLRAGSGTFSIRAGEAFASQFESFNKISSAVFPVVGLAVFATEIGRGIEQLVEFKRQVDEIPEHLQSGFGALSVGFATTNDELQLTNDTLQNSINKLEHKPQNSIAIAIDEARIAADKFAASIDADNEKLDQLLSKNHLSGWALLFGRQGTAEREGTVSYYSRQQADAGLRYQQAVQSGNKGAADKALADLHASQQSELSNVLSDRSRRQANGEINNDANIAIDTGVASALIAEQNHQAELLKNSQLAAQQKKLQAQQDAARQSSEAQRKALEEQKQRWADELAAWQASGDQTAAAISQWWALKAVTEAAGSANFSEAMRHANEETVKVISDTTRQTAEFQKSLQALGQSQSTEVAAGPNLSDADQAAKNYAIWTQNVSANRDAQQQNADALQQATIQTQLANGEITKQQAAYQIAALHAKEYAEALERINDEQSALDSNPNLTDSERKAGQSSIDLQRTQLGGRQAVQDVQDQAAIAANSWSGQFKRANQEWVGALNQQLAGLIAGQNTSWSSFFRGIAAQIAQLGLQQIESGFSGGTQSQSSGGGIGGAIKGIFGFLTGRAVGGNVDAGGTYLIGEKGPEVLTLGSQSGRVTPNNALGGTNITFHPGSIDARGAHDPAAVDAAVRRGIAAAAPSLIGNSVRAVHEQRRRSPSTRNY